jgi:hypothetical protein
MACEVGGIGDDGMVSHHDIMAQMYIGHEKIMIPDDCLSDSLHGTEIESGALANGIVIPDDELRSFALVFEILGHGAHGGKGEELIVLADRGPSIDHDMTEKSGAGIDPHIRPDSAKGSYFDIGRELCLGMNNGVGINDGHALCLSPS